MGGGGVSEGWGVFVMCLVWWLWGGERREDCIYLIYNDAWPGFSLGGYIYEHIFKTKPTSHFILYPPSSPHRIHTHKSYPNLISPSLHHPLHPSSPRNQQHQHYSQTPTKTYSTSTHTCTLLSTSRPSRPPTEYSHRALYPGRCGRVALPPPRPPVPVLARGKKWCVWKSWIRRIRRAGGCSRGGRPFPRRGGGGGNVRRGGDRRRRRGRGVLVSLLLLFEVAKRMGFLGMIGVAV